MLSIGSICSGIGFLELGLERAGFGPVIWQVEQDEFCKSVLAKHWPEADRSQDDITTAQSLRPVGLVCGGFPCQPASVAGKRRAQSDHRWLWPDVQRIVAETRPAICVFENVPGLRTAGMRDVLVGLASLRFDIEWTCISALDYGAPHLRKRLFFVATDPSRVDIRQQPGWLSRSCERQRKSVSRDALEALCSPDSDSLRRVESARRFAELRGWSGYCGWSLGEIAPVDDGRPGNVAGQHITRKRKALGNAVVVACAQAVGTAIVEALS
jgi:site-specific DNA-cytosine methylase